MTSSTTEITLATSAPSASDTTVAMGAPAMGAPPLPSGERSPNFMTVAIRLTASAAFSS